MSATDRIDYPPFTPEDWQEPTPGGDEIEIEIDEFPDETLDEMRTRILGPREPPSRPDVDYSIDYGNDTMRVTVVLSRGWAAADAGEVRSRFIFAQPGSPAQLRALADLMELDPREIDRPRAADPLASNERKLDL